MVFEPVNATGWTELIEGKIVQAPFVMFQSYWHGYALVLLFFVFQIMLILKTKNPIIVMITTIFFLGTVAFSGILPTTVMYVLYIAGTIQLLATIMYVFWSRQ